MDSIAASICEQWRALESDILVPAVLTDAQINALAAIRLPNADCLAFCHALPITVARFSPEFQARLQEVAERQTTVISTREFSEKYARETLKIHQALFGSRFSVRMVRFTIGRFTKAIAPGLHTDIPLPGKGLGVYYAARTGALPLEIIDGARRAMASPEETRLIELAREPRLGKAARKALREAGILRRVPLGEIIMLASGEDGTQHCSTPIPKGGAHSAFLFSYGHILTLG